jgi:hypothetical protein
MNEKSANDRLAELVDELNDIECSEELNELFQPETGETVSHFGDRLVFATEWKMSELQDVLERLKTLTTEAEDLEAQIEEQADA